MNSLSAWRRSGSESVKRAVVVTGEIEGGCEVDLEELLGDRAGALVVEPPARAVREDPPAQGSGREVVHAPQVAEHLGRGSHSLRCAAAGAAVERLQPALGFDHRQSKLVAPPLLGKGIRTILHRLVGEQQPVGNVLPTLGGQVLLAEARVPPEEVEDRPDQILFGLALVGGPRDGKTFEQRPERSTETVDNFVVERQPIRRPNSGFIQEIAGEQAPLEHFSDAHARTTPEPGSRRPNRLRMLTDRGGQPRPCRKRSICARCQATAVVIAPCHEIIVCTGLHEDCTSGAPTTMPSSLAFPRRLLRIDRRKGVEIPIDEPGLAVAGSVA